MRRSCSRLRRTAVLLLLALRADERTVGEEGGLHRSRGLGVRPVRSPAPDGRLPPEGGAGIRGATGPDRRPHRGGSYLHLEVRFPRRPWSAPPLLRGGECLSPFVGSSTRASPGAALRRIRSRRPSRRLPPVHGRVQDGPLRHGHLFLPLFLLSRLGREDV